MTTLFNGTAGNDLLIGTAGDDRLNGLAGDDTLDAGAGTNQIDAGDGNDLIILDGTAINGPLRTPATGIDGGAGVDTIQFAGTVADFHIVQIAGGWLQIDDLLNGGRTIATNVEHLVFTDTDLWLTPPTGPAVIAGTQTGAVTEDATLQAQGQLTITDPDPGQAAFVPGTIAGSYGSLTLQADGAWTYALDNASIAVQSLTTGTVQDVLTVTSLDGTQAQIAITITGAADTSLIIGTDASQRLQGTQTADHIWGQGGNDRITGAGGNDTVTGGTGADTFVFAGRFGQDTVTDFDPQDVIDLSRIGSLHGYSDLTLHHLTDTAQGTLLTFGANSILLQGIHAADLTAQDFLF
jgi:VCBS repeat-containing protein